MDFSRLLIIALVMGGVMMLLRVVPILFFKKEIKNRFLKSFLSYLPYAILTSLLIPEFLYSTTSVFSAVIGIVLAAALALLGQNLTVVAIASAFAVYITEWCMGIF